MKNIKLEIFNNTCAKCGKRFISYHLSPNEYNIILFETIDLQTAFLFPDEDYIWNEVNRIIEQSDELSELSKEDRLSVFDIVISKTVDEDNGRQYFIWGDMPCPQCGATEKSFFGPGDPIKFINVNVKIVTHNRWNSLSEDEKYDEVKLVIRNFREGLHNA